MHWIAPSEKDTDNAALEKRLWDAADTETRGSANHECERTRRDFRRAKDHWSTNSGLKSQEYCAPVLDPHDATGRFDFVLANPPFNAVDVMVAVGAMCNRRFRRSTLHAKPRQFDQWGEETP